MKNIIKKTTAVLASAMLIIGSSVNVFAEEAQETEDKKESIILPSGLELKEALRNIEDEMEEKCSESLENTHLGGATLAIFRGDEVIYTGHYGYTDYENGIPTDDESVFEWGSISKTLIWVSAMQLVEQGKLDLERDVREYLPEGFFQKLSYDDPITMLNIMNHNAGWCETTRSIWIEDGDTIPPLKDALQSIEPAQVTRPGERVAYSNYGAAVAGYVIECVSGMDYGEYVRKNIFEPLGMEHTSISPDHSDNSRVCEQRKKMHSYEIGVNNVDMGSRLFYVGAYPAGSATGTVSDLVTYTQALMNDDAPLFKNKETQQELFSATDFYGDSDIPVNCHGFFCNEHKVRTLFHTGGTVFGQADMEFDPESKFGIVIMHNEGLGSSWLMNFAPTYVFGELASDTYGEPVGKADYSGKYFLISRSQYKGMLKYIPVLGAIQFDEPFDELDGNVLQLTGISLLNEGADSALILGRRTLSDGSVLLESASADVTWDKFYLPKLLLLTAYLLSAVAGTYMLRIRLKLFRTHRDTKLAGSALMSISQWARLVSALTLLTSFIVYYKYTGGIPIMCMTVFGILQMICGGICGVSAAGSAVTLVVGKDKTTLYKVIAALNIAANLLCAGAIVFYELYKFWGC